MDFTLLLPGALVDAGLATALTDALPTPMLRQRLARAEWIDDARSERGAPHAQWLATVLFGQDPAPTAPYAYAALNGERPEADVTVWHADPVHLQLAGDHLLVTALPDPPSAAEADALIADANEAMAAAHATLARVGERWFLQADRRWQLAATPLAAALGESLADVLPHGDDAALWTHLLNEIQMLWHVHPVNEARAARGQAALNSIWLHGGGAWQPLPAPPYRAVHADAPELRGAAAAAGIDDAPAVARPVDRALVVWADAVDADSGHDWTAWQHALQSIDSRLAALPAAADIELVITGRRTVRRLRSGGRDRYRFWRQRRLAEVLAE
jgi:hypothetical protein